MCRNLRYASSLLAESLSACVHRTAKTFPCDASLPLPPPRFAAAISTSPCLRGHTHYRLRSTQDFCFRNWPNSRHYHRLEVQVAILGPRTVYLMGVVITHAVAMRTCFPADALSLGTRGGHRWAVQQRLP